jgi:hypothetical protein
MGGIVNKYSARLPTPPQGGGRILNGTDMRTRPTDLRPSDFGFRISDLLRISDFGFRIFV